MKNLFKKPALSEQDRMARWLKRVEYLIAENSSEPLLTGPYAGHRTTNDTAWVAELSAEISADIKRNAKGDYDNNMALAAELGKVLATWYALVHRAKSYDLNRPLEHRRKANRRVTDYRAELIKLMIDDELMGRIWDSQPYNFPYGLGAAGGTYR